MTFNELVKREIPEKWKIQKIEDFCKIFTGKKDVNQSLETGNYKFYSCAPEYKYSNEKIFDGKAILISGNGSYTGRTIFVNDSFDLYQRTYACVSKEGYDFLEYIYYYMLIYFVPVVRGGTHGSAIPYIVYDDIAKQKVLINDEVIIKFIDLIRNNLDIITNIKKENERLVALKNDLLPLLMNGQINVDDIEV